MAATRFGMSAPKAEWTSREKEVGAPLIKARRLFATSSTISGIVTTAKAEVAKGRLAVISLKPGASWADVGAGRYDTDLAKIGATLAPMGASVFFTLHHEPVGDGTATEYAKMTARWIPVIKKAAPQCLVGPILNGFPWSAKGQKMSDAEIATWLPKNVIAMSDVIAADTYHGGTLTDPKEDAGVKIKNMSAWATRVGAKALGLGEFSGITPTAITNAINAVKADPRFTFACVFNSNSNNREGVSWLLTGDRLTAFKKGIA